MALADNKAKIQALLDGINALPEAGSGEPADPVLQEKTVSPATSSQVVTADAGYDGLSKVTVNAMPTATQATPGISVSSAGLITASATQSAGYVAAGTKSATRQLTAQAAQTITPGTADKTIAAGRYLTGVQTIKGDANLLPDNIKAGVSIFGVLGTLEAGSGGGGSAEGCTVELDFGITSPFIVYTDYYDDSLCIETTTYTAGIGGAGASDSTYVTLFDVKVGSYIVVYSFGYLEDVSCTNAELYDWVEDLYGGIVTVFLIHGNAVITDM